MFTKFLPKIYCQQYFFHRVGVDIAIAAIIVAAADELDKCHTILALSSKKPTESKSVSAQLLFIVSVL